MDRLLGNKHLYQEREPIYTYIARKLLNDVHQPVIIVDWSELTEDQAFHLLRASLPIGGRTLTLHEEVHPRKNLFNRKLHKKFLLSLKALLPENCCPIIVTDAGFRGTWFEMLNHLQWDYVGRVRNRTLIAESGREHWNACKTLYDKATCQAKYLGYYQLNRSKPMWGDLYVVKQKSKGRRKRNTDGTLTSNARSNKIAKGQREPRLLVTSLGGNAKLAEKIVKIYKTRMQIEEGFRDLKSSRLGLSIKESLTRDKKRLEILLLIGMLGIFVIWQVGTLAELKKLQLRYQSNTQKNRRVLSVFYLGCQLVKQNIASSNTVSKREIQSMLDLAKQNYSYECFT